METAALVKKIQLLKEEGSPGNKRHYRFGDVVYHKGVYWKESTQFILNKERFVGTILRNYIERSPFNNMRRVNQNYKMVLCNLTNKAIKENAYNCPDTNELVIHLRLGDICVKPFFLQKNYIEIIRNHIHKCKIQKVTFCTAFHYGNPGVYKFTEEKHLKNVNRVKGLFNRIKNMLNIPIDVKSSTNIDEDFVYMVKAKYFVNDHGGFSKLIAEVNRYDRTIR